MPTHELGDSSHKFMALAVPCNGAISQQDLWKLPTVAKVLIPASFVKESDAHFDIVRENIQREVRQLNERTGRVAEECQGLQAEIKQLEADIKAEVEHMLDSSQESESVKSQVNWRCWHLMMSVYFGMTLGYFL